jgi:anti-sigma regulatory factor (Ser/Thr protein kinase)
MNDRFHASMTVPGRVESVRPAAGFLVEYARACAVPAAFNSLFEVAIVEALNNALKHTPRENDAAIHCEIEIHRHTLVVRVVHEAARAPFSLPATPAVAPWPSPAVQPWETVPSSGYGLYLIQAVFPSVRPIEQDGARGIELELTF